MRREIVVRDGSIAQRDEPDSEDRAGHSVHRGPLREGFPDQCEHRRREEDSEREPPKHDEPPAGDLADDEKGGDAQSRGQRGDESDDEHDREVGRRRRR